MRPNLRPRNHAGPARGREESERGAALLELAVLLPIVVIILALILDAGLGFAAARDTSSAARSAARIAALAGDERSADFRAIDAVRGQLLGSGDELVSITVYRSPAGADGRVPAGCGPGEAGLVGTCNVYSGAEIATYTQANFQSADCVGDPDQKWCPTSRSSDDGDYLGVGVWVTHDPTVGLAVPDDGFYSLDDRAVFALYFRDELVP